MIPVARLSAPGKTFDRKAGADYGTTGVTGARVEVVAKPEKGLSPTRRVYL